MNKEKATLILAAVALALSVFFVRESLLLPQPMMRNAPSPSLFPLIGLATAAVFAVIMGAQAFSAMRTNTETVRFYARNLFPHLLLLGAYVLALPLFGYIAASVVYLALALCVTTRAWPKSLVVALVFTAALYVLFDLLLGVPLPGGPLA